MKYETALKEYMDEALASPEASLKALKELGAYTETEKKLRLFLFKDCNRACKGCCNNDWDIVHIPVCRSFKGYNEVLLTGGEPMLKPELVFETVRKIRKENKSTKIFLYTAKLDNLLMLYFIMSIVDGITITLHEQSDVKRWKKFLRYLPEYLFQKSLRLNIFWNVGVTNIPKNWKVKSGMKWIKNCPLPKNEVLRKLKKGV